MGKVALVTDTTAYIPQEYVDRYHISVAPQVLIWGNETFRDGIDINPTDFYTRLSKATVMPTTSQASPASFEQIFSNLLGQGYDVLAVVISSKFSGTLDSAVQAKAKLGMPNIELVDSYTTAMALGFIVLETAKLSEQGASLADCKAFAEKAKVNTGVSFAVDTLEFLHRGGRIGGGSRFLGTALNIKPILEVREGRIEAVERVRTRNKRLLRLVELVEQGIAGRRPLHLATLHANAPEDAQEILDEANRRLKADEIVFSEVSPVVGTHTGPGTVGLAYLAGM